MERMERSASHQSLNTKFNFIKTGKTNEIFLPKQNEAIMDIAVDIGGSLAKVVWFSKQSEGGKLNFTKFETAKIDQCLGFLQGLLAERDEKDMGVLRIKATGGGSHKFYDLFSEKLGVPIQREDEIECLITGLNFLVRQIEYEVFTYDERRPDPMQFEETTSEIFPYMLVNIGSGVSIIKVTSNETYERISGTSLGGGTLWGLLGLLTDAKDYDEMLEMSKIGDNATVDMLVGDIYGGDYPKIGLKATTIASSFGKVIKVPPEERKKKFKQQDIARSLLYLVSNNIGQIAFLNAQAHGITRIYFSGFYISGHTITMNTLSYAISFWSKGEIKANFLRHEGYLGAIGAFLHDPPMNAKLHAFTENFSTIDGMSTNGLYAVGSLEEHSSEVYPLPLLADPSQYIPDTSKLAADPKLQTYWIDLLDANLHYLIELAVKKDPEAESRATKFENMYRQHLQELRQRPKAYGDLTVRSLLNLREQCLRQMGFNDIFRGVKEQENEAALKVVKEMFRYQDTLDNPKLVETLINNIMAGNMLDWGSTLIQEMFLKNGFDFDAAKSKLVFSPGFSNQQDFVDRLLLSKPYKKCLIFVDNSGADILFGILPFVRFLLQQGTAVVLGANSIPSVNDITASELQKILEELAHIDSIFGTSLANGSVKAVGTGSGSPCLDLLRVSNELCEASRDVDLVIIEGMGRAIHTNYYAEFLVDSLKIAVFKNPQIAKELGAQLYEGFKWDAIELSDDEDFECHPNVDKKSMIRWKQAQIHKERREREDQRDLLRMEYDTTEKFLEVLPEKIKSITILPPPVIPGFLSALGQEIDKSFTDPMRQESLKRMNNWNFTEPPVWGDVLRSHVPWNEEINSIMKKTEEYIETEDDVANTSRFVLKLFDESFQRFKYRQSVILKQIKEFETTMSKKLTMDNLVTGFDKTFVAKDAIESVASASSAEKSFKPATTKVIETIHSPKDSIKEPIIDEFLMEIFDEMESRDEDLNNRHVQLLAFSQKSDFSDVAKMLRQHPTLLTEKNEEALLLRALCLACIGKNKEARACVQNSTIIKFTRNLGGSDSVDLFFSKLHGTGSSAQNLFFTELNKTYEHIIKRGGVLRQGRVEKKIQHEKQQAKKREIYESFKQPDGTLKLSLGPEPTEIDLKQKEWFDNLPEDYKEGLLLEDVDKINAYLGSLNPEEADFQANMAAKSGFIQFEEENEENEEND